MDSLAELFPLLIEGYTDIPEVQDGIVRIAWSFCVGEKIRKISEPVRFGSGVLKVKVAHPQWKTTLEEMKPQIIARMNQYIRKNLVANIELL